MRDISVGMTKENVIDKLGKRYIISSLSEHSQGERIEVLAYKSSVNEEYRLKFINNKLQGWDRLVFRDKYPQTQDSQ